jgi:hypothetical protein
VFLGDLLLNLPQLLIKSLQIHIPSILKSQEKQGRGLTPIKQNGLPYPRLSAFIGALSFLPPP